MNERSSSSPQTSSRVAGHQDDEDTTLRREHGADPVDAAQAAVELSGISKTFDGPSGTIHALRTVSLSIARNEFFTLLGPSGCGKTTLLRLIAGFEIPDAGEIRLDGEAIADRPPYQRLVNTVFQSYALFPHKTVGENIGFGLKMRRVPPEEARERVDEMLSLVRLDGMARHVPDQLSGGQQQRVALARALANRPKVLLLDEPLSALDYKLRKDMRLELKRLQRETGITFIFVTHDQDEALEMSDRIAVMSEGAVQQVGDPVEIYDRPVNRFVADFIGETNFLDVDVESREAGTLKCRTADGGAIQAAGEAAPGDRVTVAIRPEKTIVEPAGAQPTGLEGEVVARVYQGSTTAYHVRLAGGQVMTGRSGDSDGDNRHFTNGERVRLRIRPDGARVVA